MVIILPIILCGTVILLVYYGKFVYSRRNMYKHAAAIPGLPQLPLIGNAHQFTGSLMKIMSNLMSSHGDEGIVKMWLGPKLFIGVSDPSSFEIILNEALVKEDGFKFLKPWLGEGLFTGEIKIWRKHRKMLSPTFNQKILNGYVDIFVDQSNTLVEKLSAEIEKGQFNAFNYITSFTLDTICETTLGVKVNAQRNMNQSYVLSVKNELSLFVKRVFNIWLKPQWIYNLTPYAKAEKKSLKILHEFTNSIVQQKRLENAKKNVKRNDSKIKFALDLMMELNENGQQLNDIEIREEVDTLIFTGNETTALINGFTLMILGKLPHIQDRVIDELREIFGDSNRPVCKEDLSKMQYMERVIKETLRLFPAVPTVLRLLDKDIKLEKYTLPAGSGCIVSIWGVHRDKKYWGENAEEFDPDRFLPENSVNRHPYAYLPFARGARDCIGKHYAMMQMKIAICTVLRSYKIHSTVDYKNVELEILGSLNPVHGHLISIERRNKL